MIPYFSGWFIREAFEEILWPLGSEEFWVVARLERKSMAEAPCD
jgi:hypothetical protein